MSNGSPSPRLQIEPFKLLETRGYFEKTRLIENIFSMVTL